MKNRLINIAIVLLFCSGFLACSDWTETESNDYYNAPSENYYKSLKAYKKSDHSVAFGWYGNWTGAGATQANCLMGLPDSVDFVSMWGNWHSLSADKMADKARVKELKGTRCLVCFIIANIGDQLTPNEVRENYRENGFATEADAVYTYWGWPTDQEAAVRKYARALIDTIAKYDFDGFDLDLEPHYGSPGNIASYSDKLGIFIDEMSKFCGPKSGTDRLLVVDGEPYEIPSEYAEHINYYILQAYSSSSDSGLDSRLGQVVSAFKEHMTEEEVTRRIIVCENFEAFASAGGVPYRLADGRIVPSLIGMAQWEPSNGFRKGGVGSYHMEYEYPLNPEYKYLRQAIGIMNPAVK